MTHRRAFRSIRAIPALAMALLLVAPVFGQDEGQEAAESGVSVAEQRDEAMESIDRILESDREALAGEGYIYDPQDRRDPFRSLLQGSEELEEEPVGEGIPSLRIDEIDLTGIFVTGSGAVAQIFSASQGKSFLLREGDQLRDGDVISISPTEIVFKQDVSGLDELKPFREVVKKLNS
jgi:hypothetical protein